MREFKFFQRETSYNSWTLDGDTVPTESLDSQRRRIEDGERAYRFERRAREECRIMMEEERDIIRRLNEPTLYVKGSIELNPKWWMKIKMFYQKFKYNTVIETNSDALTIFFITTTVTIIFGLVIAKILNVW